MSDGKDFACALVSSPPGAVRCWGESYAAQLGDGTVSKELKGPVTVRLPEPAVDVALGSSSACARLVSGKVYCWGSDREWTVGGVPAATPAPRSAALGGFGVSGAIPPTAEASDVVTHPRLVQVP